MKLSHSFGKLVPSRAMENNFTAVNGLAYSDFLKKFIEIIVKT
jgi:hypothetical protein